jgi:hypothetical protein
MSKFPETRVLAEQALRHVLDQQAMLLKMPNNTSLIEIVSALNNLAIETSNLLVNGFNRSRPLHAFTKEAKAVEVLTDRISEKIWKHLPVSISGIYENLEKSIIPREGHIGLADETRAHFHNLRIRLLEQLLGARMLAMNSDLGEETERVWIQFLERHLGPSLRVLRGGHISDHKGNRSSQIDLIVVGSDAQVFLPADSQNGKAHVLIDQVVAAIMVTSNLTTEKLKQDWKNLQSIPSYGDLERDFPNFKDHPWPLVYIVGAQSDPIDRLKLTWQIMCKEGATKVVPQFVITLDDGFLYGGWRRSPCPRYPGNYTAVDHVKEVTGVYAGLGLGWFILQQQARIADVHRRVLKPIERFANLLDNASLTRGNPPTWSERFNAFFLPRDIGGVFEWGGMSCFAHNRFYLMSLERTRRSEKTIHDPQLYQDGTDIESLKFEDEIKFLRWFHYPAALTRGRILAIEELIHAFSKEKHTSKIAVFDMVTGDEIRCPFIDGLTSLPNMEELEKEVHHFIPDDGLLPEEKESPGTANRMDLIDSLRTRNLY